MKILWLCNIMFPAIAKILDMEYSNREGWLTGIYERIEQENGRQKETGALEMPELGICFPMENLPEKIIKENGRFLLGKTVCYGFRERLSAPEIYDMSLETVFIRILEDFKPDMVHIFGTEFPHTLAMIRAYNRPERTLVGIQGLCFACAEVYMADLPVPVRKRVTFRDFIKKDSIMQQQEKFRIRGEREKEAIKKTGHITGRTDFDRKETKRINPDAEYHFMNETMRLPFYSGRWEADKCIPYSIFLSQGDYPLKGFHYVLSAMPGILRKYPKACIYVAGNSIINDRTWKDKLKMSSYGKYLSTLIAQSGLKDKVKILGKLSAEEMKEQYLRSSVFVCPSSVENSPNSLGEAMLLGVPAVAAAAGGIPSLLENEKEGLLFEPGNTVKLAEAVMRIWEEPENTAGRTDAAREKAWERHSADKNFTRLIEIYREICS